MDEPPAFEIEPEEKPEEKPEETMSAFYPIRCPTMRSITPTSYPTPGRMVRGRIGMDKAKGGGEDGFETVGEADADGTAKAALALGYAGYVEAETQAGRKPVGKRAWRETLAGPSTLRVASE